MVAIRDLIGIGALNNSEQEALTPLGTYTITLHAVVLASTFSSIKLIFGFFKGNLLTKLPVDARLGKLILYGVCFGCPDEALTIAACLASRSPFLCPIEVILHNNLLLL